MAAAGEHSGVDLPGGDAPADRKVVVGADQEAGAGGGADGAGHVAAERGAREVLGHLGGLPERLGRKAAGPIDPSRAFPAGLPPVAAAVAGHRDDLMLIVDRPHTDDLRTVHHRHSSVHPAGRDVHDPAQDLTGAPDTTLDAGPRTRPPAPPHLNRR